MTACTRFPPRSINALLAVSLLLAGAPCGALALPDAPRLAGIDTAGSETVGFAAPGGPLIVPVTQLRLRFDAPLATQPGTGVESPANFRLIEAGADGLLATSTCGAQAGGDDAFVTLLAATWNSVDNEAVLHPEAAAGLPRGHYRVIACDSLLGLGGLPLDGDGDGLPGGVALRDFAILETNGVANPGFDASADGWEAVPLGLVPVGLARAPLDADGAASSGALRVASGPLSGPALVRPPACVTVGFATPSPTWRTRLRYRVMQGNVRVQVNAWFGFTGDAGETGCDGPGMTDSRSFTASAAGAFATFDTGWQVARPFPLATMSIQLSATDGLPFEILLDDVGFSLDSQVIFRDDFHGY
jgi:hypothetical protein